MSRSSPWEDRAGEACLVDAPSKLIQQRYSCRTYANTPIPETIREQLRDFIAAHETGPFGTRVRMALIAATQEDHQALKGLGTYGFISGATGFLVGAVPEAADANLEDFGYVLETFVLFATGLELGTVWLGGTFTKSRFADVFDLAEDEMLPAVIATGYPADNRRGLDVLIRRQAKSDKRLPWEQLFFDLPSKAAGLFERSLTRAAAGLYAQVLDMVRRAPSASNKQPWRIVRQGDRWHLYLQRTWGYAARNALVGVADMQRIDMGIAMCHFELTAAELGLAGHWERSEPELDPPDALTAYVVSWVAG